MIPIRSLQHLELGSISLYIDFPAEVLELVDVTSLIKGKMTYQLHDGVLKISWYSLAPISVSPGDELIMLKCRNALLNPLNNNKKHMHSGRDPLLGIQSESRICDGNSINMPNVVLSYPRLCSR